MCRVQNRCRRRSRHGILSDLKGETLDFSRKSMAGAQIMVNLIPYNPIASLDTFRAPSHERVERFLVWEIMVLVAFGPEKP